MAKINTEPKYYAYYDRQTGNILCATGRKSTEYEHGIEITFDEASNFVSGKWKFQDYMVGYKDPDNKSSIALLSRDYVGYTFKNSLVEWITCRHEYADCIVEWDGVNSSWNFYLDPEFKKTYNNIADSQLMFFVTLETDFDFLIRTIYIKLSKLLSEKSIIIPFESNVEHKIDKISISTKLVFKSYKLKVIHE